MTGRMSWVTDLTITDWGRRARCKLFYGLPWTADKEPEPETLSMMAGVCEGCPVRRECAEHALSDPEQGGFWAGVWLPWWFTGDYPARKQQKLDARAELRSRLAVTPPLSERSQV